LTFPYFSNIKIVAWGIVYRCRLLIFFYSNPIFSQSKNTIKHPKQEAEILGVWSGTMAQ
jgi:hypothetical protein